MNPGTLRWVDFAGGLRTGPLRTEAWIAAMALASAALTLWQPLGSSLVAAAGLALALCWRRPESAVYALVVLMGNVKINYYAGFFTFFPEYLVLLVAGLAWLLRLAEAPRPLPEPAFVGRYALWMLAGAISFVFAPLVGKVFARVVLSMIAAVVVLLTCDALRDRRILRRVLAVWEVSAAVFALYGIVQMLGLIAGVDLAPKLLERYGNPDLAVGVGEPLSTRFELIFRANSLFNDPNILAGYLSAAIAATLALRAHHAAAGRHARAGFETVGLAVMGVCLLLTISRSGFLAMAAGLLVVLWQWPGVLRRPAFWLVAGLASVAILATQVALGQDPLVIVQRFIGSFDTNDGSNRVHWEVFLYGIQLALRYPLTGVGLGNFGEFYGPEANAYARDMMTHCAPLSAFAETGVFGGVTFIALVLWVLSRAWRLARDRELRVRDPEMHAFATAVLAALVAIDVANIFYDYYMRTFVWVISGLAIALPRLAAHGEGARPA